MASKKPLCHYSGYTKQIQPGDTFNAPDYLVVGSTVGSGNNVHINEKGSTGVWLQVSNDTTGHSLASGFHFGIGGAEDANLRNYSNTDMKFWTDNTTRMYIRAAGDVHVLTNASVDGNLVVGGNMTVLGSMNVESSTLYEGSNQFGIVASDIQLLVGQITASGPLFANESVFINETANTKMTLGLTINQGTYDNEILAFKASEVAHSYVSFAESDTYGTVDKVSAVAGGLRLTGLKDADSTNAAALALVGYLMENVDTTKSTTGRALMEVTANQISGDAVANVVANGNIFAVRARVGGSTVSRWILDEDGDTWQSGNVTAANASINGYIKAGSYVNAPYMSVNNGGTFQWDVNNFVYGNTSQGQVAIQAGGVYGFRLYANRAWTSVNASFDADIAVGGYINDLRITATAGDNTGAGMKTNMVAGENLVFGDFCYVNTDGEMQKADADAGTTTPTIAMALETINNNASGDFLLDGFAFDTAWNWTVGSTLYTSVTAGDISHVIPSGSGDQVQVVGIAIHADRIRFSPSLVRVEVA